MANIDLNQYEKMYGYTIGKLIDGDTGEEITKSEKAIFDNESLNFHFYPSDEERCKKFENEISEKFMEIKGIIKDKKYATYTLTGYNPEVMGKDKIYFWVESSGQLKQNRKKICNLFKFIGAIVNGNLYELNFMRFYIGTNKSVNCILKSIQFDRIVGNKNTNIIKETANKYGICYPDTDKHHESLQNLINTNKNKNFFYNPQIEFDAKDASDANAEKILVAFVEFIGACEGKKLNL